MDELRQDLPALATPVNVLLLLWMAVGRGLFVPLGWMTVFVVLVSPVLVLCLWATARMLRRLGKQVTSGQAVAQVVLWAAMFVFGLACVDGGDSGTTYSILMKVFGQGARMESASNLLWAASVIVGIAAWVVLHAKLTKGIALMYSGPGPSR